MQSVPIPTNVVSSNPAQTRCTRYKIMWVSLSVTCDRSVAFSGYSGFLHQESLPPRFKLVCCWITISHNLNGWHKLFTNLFLKGAPIPKFRIFGKRINFFYLPSNFDAVFSSLNWLGWKLPVDGDGFSLSLVIFGINFTDRVWNMSGINFTDRVWSMSGINFTDRVGNMSVPR